MTFLRPEGIRDVQFNALLVGGIGQLPLEFSKGFSSQNSGVPQVHRESRFAE
jgi:hypothetical protein